MRDLDEQFGTGYAAAALPPHVSLKQPFEVEDVEALEAYAGALAGEVEPVAVVLESLRVWHPDVAWLSMADGGRLGRLKEQLDRELPEALGHPVPADHDDDDIAHLTIAHRGGAPEAYRPIERAFASVRFDRPAVLERLHLFVSREEVGRWDFMDLSGRRLGSAADPVVPPPTP